MDRFRSFLVIDNLYSGTHRTEHNVGSPWFLSPFLYARLQVIHKDITAALLLKYAQSRHPTLPCQNQDQKIRIELNRKGYMHDSRLSVHHTRLLSPKDPKGLKLSTRSHPPMKSRRFPPTHFLSRRRIEVNPVLHSVPYPLTSQ